MTLSFHRPMQKASTIIMIFAIARESLGFTVPSGGTAFKRCIGGIRLPMSTSKYDSQLFSESKHSMNDSGEDLSERAREVLDEMTQNIVSSDSNPFASTLRRVGKSDIYPEDELMKVLNIHNEFSELGSSEVPSRNEQSSPGKSQLSLHELVLTSIEDEPVVANDTTVLSLAGKISAPVKPSSFQVDSAMQERLDGIRGIASDVDGTLLSSRQTLHPRTRAAIKRALQYSAAKTETDGRSIDFFFPATGKSRKGALDSLGIEIGSLIAEGNVPGVYLQGLFCVDGRGNVVFEKKLKMAAIVAAEDLVKKTGISVVAYDGDDLFTTNQTEIVMHLHEHYGEPLPRLLMSASSEAARKLSEHEPSMHKLLLMDDDVEKLRSVVRPQLEVLAAEFDATVTQALPTMLELLPAGCSKAMGVTKLCDALGLDMGKELLALGDAENDAEMLSIAACGVAMGNGCPIAKQAADFVMEETNDDGAAGVAMELFAFGDLK